MNKLNERPPQTTGTSSAAVGASTGNAKKQTLAAGKKPRASKIKNKDLYRENDFSDRIETQIKNGKKMTGSSRKNQISINHLLDFQSYQDLQEYQDRRRTETKDRRRRRSSSSNQRRLQHKVNLKGMSYINCHYKFVVDYRGEYKPQQLDPNIPVDVADILRIITPRGNACPICLSDEPVAPRMITSCGHMLCLTCLLSLLDSELPTIANKKRSEGQIAEKYNDCPLCSSIIRERDIKPVLISNIDELYEIPKTKEEVVLSLMTRPQNKLLSLPQIFSEFHGVIDTFPWVKQGNSIGNVEDDELPDFSVYLRFLMGDLQYIIGMYEKERQDITEQYEQEKLLYNDDGKFFKLALQNIDQDIKNWKEKFEAAAAPKNTTLSSHFIPSPSNTFFFYQTGLNTSSTFVLSPLDMKVLKHSYGDDYAKLPSSIIAKIENIRYEEFNTDLALTKYKYLSHLPFGTNIGFLECDWSQNEFICPETWEFFKNDLLTRSKNSNRKFKREELNRRKALNEEEIRNREFFERENGNHGVYNSMLPPVVTDYESNGSFSSMTRNLGSLTITDYRELPLLSDTTNTGGGTSGSFSEGSGALESIPSSPQFQTTIWGTKIPKLEGSSALVDSEDDWDAEEMIRKAKEEMDKQELEGTNSGKRKKKKKIVLSSAW